MNIEQTLMQKCPIYMTPFVSTMDLLNHAYDAYDIYITEREFSKRLNDLCFPATLAIPNGSDIYILFADAFEVIKYEKSRHDPNPLRINGSKISGGLRVRSIKKLPESGIDETVEILEGLFENFKHNLINDPILDTTKDIKSLTSEEFCRAFNIVESIRLHTSIIRMCIQFVSLVIPHESKKIYFLDIDAIHSFQFYPALLVGILLAGDTNVFCNPTQAQLEDVWHMYTRTILNINTRPATSTELNMVIPHIANKHDTAKLRVVDLDTINIALTEFACYKPNF